MRDCGHTLQYYIGKLRLNMRMQIVYELLKLALELTDGTAHRDYSFYLTDLTADNIAIQIDSSTGLLLSLKIIDWSDVIVVSNKENRFKCKLNFHYSECIECCPGCLIYSEDDICKTSYSDHNIYAVCQEFLSSGESILPEITNTNILENSNYAEFQTLIKNCVCDRSTEHQVIRNRLNTAKLMITLLEKILKITF
ncbi:divergent protein kinase domain 2A-like isoform X3 [Daktulosphaira vitifoliae]|uniref:divergent protein kinase domain 2A-like isoform X3 n=1 Tax=Daktulosphaira vitifoliae TaxID=58002 RepID=UPI0021AAA831|nr:divergent protein kinase domain 2A-like isoform X3 [Daktulosphaira vitifoliae]